MTDPRNPRSSAAKNHPIGIVVLAAGGSRRMKRPKQLLEFEGRTLLRRAVSTAIESICAPVVVVLGADFEQTKAELEDLEALLVYNENWQNGLSSSIKTGLDRLLQAAPDMPAAVITLADQPFVRPEHLNLLAAGFYRSGDSVVAARYHRTIGVPALFARATFADFESLAGDKGAKMIIEKHADSLSTIDLPEAAFDIDTPQDFAKLSGDLL